MITQPTCRERSTTSELSTLGKRCTIMIRTDELPAMRACATKSRSRMLNLPG